ncbi:tRNA (adenosine(37)-N6)-threonylcarbamoyltransferase complex transferase subunit TsaD [Desulfococcaceae bacterium OttesenSCG-928-F15]|nr:tRNA (adenosine(37)-N6)-threonylcarbamoyltransferase complex transferase subunit TsaD [Desulfococcaceae bacterium OttesenSCG-928-F15]
MRILGIESSCDETAVAIVEDGVRILASEVASQVKIHEPYGGVVPELASRHHLEAVCPLVDRVFAVSGLAPGDIDAIAATQGPGLVGALLVGFSFAKAYAMGLGIPCIGVNHLLGHIHSIFLERDEFPDYPFVALVVSGGHTALYRVENPTSLTLLGQTRDDAAGEAYDKVAKMMGLGYPGGVYLDRLAEKGKLCGLAFPRALLDRESLDFSFSGLKSSVARFLSEDKGKTPEADIAAAFQDAVSDVLVTKSMLALEREGCRDFAVVGGVSANSGLRKRAEEATREKGIRLHLPALSLCGDNAAMIAAAGYHVYLSGSFLAADADVYSRATAPR